MARRKVTVLVDSREQIPLLFPDKIVWCPEPYKPELVELEFERRELEAGDYCLKHCQHIVGTERKRSMDELAANLLTWDRARFRSAWSRFLGAYAYPVLYLEQPFSSAARDLKGKYEKITAPDVLSEFFRLGLEVSKLTVIWAGRSDAPGPRREAGANLVRLMLSYEYTYRMLNPVKKKEEPSGGHSSDRSEHGQ